MNNTSTDRIAASREAIRGFGQQYDYDVTYVEALMDALPGAFQAFEGAMSIGLSKGRAHGAAGHCEDYGRAR